MPSKPSSQPKEIIPMPGFWKPHYSENLFERRGVKGNEWANVGSIIKM
jgi:hypothetical protein